MKNYSICWRRKGLNINFQSYFWYYLKECISLHKMLIDMSRKAINRIKAVLAEQAKTNKWLAEQLNKN